MDRIPTTLVAPRRALTRIFSGFHRGRAVTIREFCPRKRVFQTARPTHDPPWRLGATLALGVHLALATVLACGQAPQPSRLQPPASSLENLRQLSSNLYSGGEPHLSGRMATSGLMTSLPADGALAVAHAITTHAVEPQDVDWFTAVDDLTQDAGETGAGHLNTQQFSAGVFYRYASLNLKQLQVNLGLLPDIKAGETPESRKRALEIAKHVFHMLATVVPSAKQQSFAAHNPADFAIISFGDQPISLANAFEQPVRRARDGGYFDPSVQRLADYWARINRAYGLDEQARAFSLRDDVELGNRPSLGSLREIESWIEEDGQA